MQVSEGLNSVETICGCIQGNTDDSTFQKDLIVWKLCCDEKGHIIKSVSEGLNSVETSSPDNLLKRYYCVSEGLNSVET